MRAGVISGSVPSWIQDQRQERQRERRHCSMEQFVGCRKLDWNWPIDQCSCASLTNGQLIGSLDCPHRLPLSPVCLLRWAICCNRGAKGCPACFFFTSPTWPLSAPPHSPPLFAVSLGFCLSLVWRATFNYQSVSLQAHWLTCFPYVRSTEGVKPTGKVAPIDSSLDSLMCSSAATCAILDGCTCRY